MYTGETVSETLASVIKDKPNLDDLPADTPPAIRHGAPELGEHTEEVLLELGYGWDDIAKLRENGALG